jgi:hypothetical protein
MVEVKLNKSNNNPFYGLRNCLKLSQAATGNITYDLLDSCYNEVKDNKEHREMFFSLLFSIGDITNRQHNIFKNIKKDNGGNANRGGFYNIMLWMRDKHFAQFKKFLFAGLFNEYSCFDMLFCNRVQTSKNRVVKVYQSFNDITYCSVLLEYVYKVINGTNPYNKFLVAKFLTLPRLSRRSKHKKMLDETKKVMEAKAKFLIQLSELMGWEYEVNGTYCNFKGYRRWRQEYNQDLESVLFSTGKIFDFDKDSFINWFDKLPAQARFRVKNRILYSKNADESFKYAKFQTWYTEWETFKTKKQEEQRILEEKVRQNQATEEDKVKLAKVKKEAKVTTGATNFKELYEDLKSGTVDKLKLESFMNKVNLPYNSLVIIDDSGSMRGEPFSFATFIAAACLVKNPDDDGRNLLGFFNNYSHWHSFIDKTARTTNSLLRTEVAKTKASPFVDPTLSFYDNYMRIKEFCNAVFQNGCTNISSIPEGLYKACQSNPAILDALKSYPVWTIISDGEWNNLWSPEASINDFMRKCENYFGFRPFIVAIDIDGRYCTKSSLKVDRFSGIDNMIYIPANPAQIEMFLTNFKDLDTADVYIPLQSIYRSNRYELVRKFTL